MLRASVCTSSFVVSVGCSCSFAAVVFTPSALGFGSAAVVRCVGASGMPLVSN